MIEWWITVSAAAIGPVGVGELRNAAE